MIRINNIKLNIGGTKDELDQIIKKRLRLSYVPDYTIARMSIDSRDKAAIHRVLSVDVTDAQEERILHKVHDKHMIRTEKTAYVCPAHGDVPMKRRPVIIGCGPAGLFAGLFLAREGYRPLLLDRGKCVEERTTCVEGFFQGTQPLNENCNVQFGEGGAGTFSDGKLNTGIKDTSGRKTEVLKTLAAFGAEPSILYLNKPHIGTDVLTSVVRNIRNEILRLGGEVRFDSLLTDLEVLDRTTTKAVVRDLTDESGARTYEILTDALVLAVGHSARDTFELLYDKRFPIIQKPFAMGLRIEHKRRMIDRSQYGTHPEFDGLLPAADYKLTHHASNGRPVYTFCMCPGGYVVNASSEDGRLCVNGMSFHARDAENSNSAIVVGVTPDDFGSKHPLAGMYCQRKWEERAYRAGNGGIPVQTFGDYRRGVPTKELGSVTPLTKGAYTLTDLKTCLPEVLKDAIIDGVLAFDRQIQGFASDDAVLSGIEARTSSPVRILRNEALVLENTCIYPCGEGAGYAGGITSAAVDGIRVFEAVASRYAPCER